MPNRATDIEAVSEYVRRLILSEPHLVLGRAVTVVAVESITAGTLAIDLDDGTTVRMDLQRYQSESLS